MGLRAGLHECRESNPSYTAHIQICTRAELYRIVNLVLELVDVPNAIDFSIDR
jgi:hypothetical protein